MYFLGLVPSKFWNEMERINMVITAVILSFAVSLFYSLASFFVSDPPKVDINNNEIQDEENEQEAEQPTKDNKEQSVVENLTAQVFNDELKSNLEDEIILAPQTTRSSPKSKASPKQQAVKPAGQPKRWNDPIFDNQTFVIVFDIPTPRPHLIIRHHQSKKGSVKDLNDLELDHLYDLIVEFRRKFNLEETSIILSFHTGVWATDPKFHAHICLSESDYIKLFDQSNISVQGFKPSRKWTIKSMIGTMNDLYKKNVEENTQLSRAQSQDYVTEELDAIANGLVPHNSFKRLVSSNFKTEFDSTLPHVTWTPTPLTFKLLKLQRKQAFHLVTKEMCEFVNSQGLFDRRGGDGAHICLNLNAESSADIDYLSGYVRLRVDTYYSINPRRDGFLKNFKTQRHLYTIQT